MSDVFTAIGVMATGGATGAVLIWLARNWMAFCDWKARVDGVLAHVREAINLYGTPDGVYRTLFDRMRKLEADTYTDESIGILRQHIAELEGKLDKLKAFAARLTNMEIEVSGILMTMEEWKADGRDWNTRIIALEETAKRGDEFLRRLDKLERWHDECEKPIEPVDPKGVGQYRG